MNDGSGPDFLRRMTKLGGAMRAELAALRPPEEIPGAFEAWKRFEAALVREESMRRMKESVDAAAGAAHGALKKSLVASIDADCAHDEAFDETKDAMLRLPEEFPGAVEGWRRLDAALVREEMAGRVKESAEEAEKAAHESVEKSSVAAMDVDMAYTDAADEMVHAFWELKEMLSGDGRPDESDPDVPGGGGPNDQAWHSRADLDGDDEVPF